MATYSAPTEILPIFNVENWIPFNDDPLTVAEGDGRYLKLTGGTERGRVVFNQGLESTTDINVSNGAFLVDYSTGNSGFGVPVPTERIDVDGNVNIGALNTFNIGGNPVIDASSLGSNILN